MSEKRFIQLTAFVITVLFTLSACGKIPFLPGTKKQPTVTEIESDEVERIRTEPTGKETGATNGMKIKLTPPADLSDDWTSLQFAFRGKVYDLIGHTVADLGNDWAVDSLNYDEILEGGRQATFGLTPPGVEMGYDFGLFSVVVTNQQQGDVPAEEAEITEVRLDCNTLFTLEDVDYGNPIDGFIVAGGLATYDEAARIRQLYGEPDEIEEGSVFKTVKYISGDVLMSLSITTTAGMEMLSSVTLTCTAEPHYVVRQRALVEADQQDDMGKDAYLNVAGYKVTIGTPFIDFKEAVELCETDARYEDKDEELQADQIIAPQDEMNYSGRLKGYGNSFLYLRLFNPGTEEIKAQDAVIIGIDVTNTDYDSDSPYQIPVSGPFNVRMGEPFEDALDKIPDDVLDKGFPEDGGGYVTYDVDNLRYNVITMPDESRAGAVNNMTLTLLR